LNINRYCIYLENILNTSTIVAAYKISIDKRTEDIALISGKVDFRDGSVLDFKEFVENTKRGIEKYKYSYNYRNSKETVFRYDNAPDPNARGLKSFPHHKHTADGGIDESHEVEIIDVMDEIEKIITRF